MAKFIKATLRGGDTAYINSDFVALFYYEKEDELTRVYTPGVPDPAVFKGDITDNLINSVGDDGVETYERLKSYRKPAKVKPYKPYSGQCPNCGAAFLDSSTKFCGNCGQALDWSSVNGSR